MIKRVKSSDLKLGMYVHDLNVPWLEHGFVRNRFLIENESQLEKIVQSDITEVLIDTLKGLDATNAPSAKEADTALMNKMISVATAPSSSPAHIYSESRWAESKQIHDDAVKVVGSVLKDIRFGRQVDVRQASPVVSHITDAILGNDGTLVSLCRIKQRDTYTFQHSVSISALLVTFCNSMGGFSEGDLLDIGLGGLFHDAGKLRIPDKILNKPGKLTEEEFAIMRTHVSEGLKFLDSSRGLSDTALRIVGEHHERHDGTGYPKGISRNAISLLGQMASIVDVYDAITSKRVYHPALEPSDALKRIFEWSGRHFEDTLVQRFIKAIGIYPVGSLVHLESGHLAVVLRTHSDNMLQPLVRIVYDALDKTKLAPQDIDLAAPNCQDRIVGYEIPSNWGIDPLQFVGKAPAN